MHCHKFFVLGFVLLAALPGIARAEADVPGSQDHPLFTRMPGYAIADYSVKDFDKYESTCQPPDTTWEGKVTTIQYSIHEGAKQPSMLQIARNYAAAMKKIGGKVLEDQERVIEGKIAKKGATTWVHVAAFNEGRNYEVVIVEQGGMKQDVVADAAALSSSIAATGKAAVYGIYFDTDQSEIKPESKAALDEIVKLLQQNAKLKLYVVGHTDGTGALEHNCKLSADRAASVVKALAGRGVAAARLKAHGAGPYCPVGSNRTEEGKAQNRRVELVEWL